MDDASVGNGALRQEIRRPSTAKDSGVEMDSTSKLAQCSESDDVAVAEADVLLSEPNVGQYKFKEIIGRGTFSTVLLYEHVQTGEEVAIKRINKTIQCEDYLSRMYREVESMKALTHPNIVRLIEYIDDAEHLHLVMEYAVGGELLDYLKTGRRTESEARRIFRQLLSAVQYCHRKGVVHRDLKAENILLDAGLNIKIADFGLSRFFSDAKLSTFCGSPLYAAPELYKGIKYYGPTVDAWSLGIILYYMMTGSVPFYGDNHEEVKRFILKGKFRVPLYVSGDCEKLLRKLIVVNPKKRLSLELAMADRWVNCGFAEADRLRPYVEPIVIDRDVDQRHWRTSPISPAVSPISNGRKPSTSSMTSESDGSCNSPVEAVLVQPPLSDSATKPNTARLKKSSSLKDGIVRAFNILKPRRAKSKSSADSDHVQVVKKPREFEAIAEANETNRSYVDVWSSPNESATTQRFNFESTSSKSPFSDGTVDSDTTLSSTVDGNVDNVEQSQSAGGLDQLSFDSAIGNISPQTNVVATSETRRVTNPSNGGTVSITRAAVDGKASDASERHKPMLRNSNTSVLSTRKRLSAVHSNEPAIVLNRQHKVLDRRSRQLKMEADGEPNENEPSNSNEPIVNATDVTSPIVTSPISPSILTQVQDPSPSSPEKSPRPLLRLQQIGANQKRLKKVDHHNSEEKPSKQENNRQYFEFDDKQHSGNNDTEYLQQQEQRTDHESKTVSKQRRRSPRFTLPSAGCKGIRPQLSVSSKSAARRLGGVGIDDGLANSAAVNNCSDDSVQLLTLTEINLLQPVSSVDTSEYTDDTFNISDIILPPPDEWLTTAERSVKSGVQHELAGTLITEHQLSLAVDNVTSQSFQAVDLSFDVLSASSPTVEYSDNVGGDIVVEHSTPSTVHDLVLNNASQIERHCVPNKPTITCETDYFRFETAENHVVRTTQSAEHCVGLTELADEHKILEPNGSFRDELPQAKEWPITSSTSTVIHAEQSHSNHVDPESTNHCTAAQLTRRQPPVISPKPKLKM